MSQPPLTQQIRQLEEEVGATLLLRNQRKVELTAAGVAFLVRAREILDAVEDAAREARRVQRGEVGRLAVGFVGSAMYSFVPELLRAFRDEKPDIGLRLHELGTTEQLRQLEDGRLDVGFVRLRGPRPGLAHETVLDEPVVVALPGRAPARAATAAAALGPRGRVARPAHARGLARAAGGAGGHDRPARRRGADRAGGGRDADRRSGWWRPGSASRSCRSPCARSCATASATARSWAKRRSSGWRWSGARPTNRRCSRCSWSRHARRPPPKEREVDGGRARN